MRVILASASPRRKELLKNIFSEFSVIPADIDENIGADTEAEKLPEKIACLKAGHIARDNPGALVIGCDTAVIVGGEILGKPKDRADCVRMLRLLSGRKHKVITGCCLCLNGRKHSFSDETSVEFYTLTDKETEEYLKAPEENGPAKYQWQDKAGGYGIQGAARLFVKGIEGDYNNVVGLPCSRLNREIKNFLAKPE